ncbi:MAG: sulfotransferase domain-containing protein [Clostridiales bacterium]|nr:sulfotransferase domain-containing protein [Clostridiales bacterium]
MIEKLPNLIIPGAQKSGTSTLFRVIIQHPEIYMSVKEPHFFSLHFDRGIEYYKGLFVDADKEKYLVDMTPVYMLLDDVPGLISNTIGDDLKFVFILRNPVDRAYSSYWMKRLNFRDNIDTFEEALACEELRIIKGKMPLIDFSYKTRGFYARQIKNFLKYFPRENMHFMIFEDFIKDIEGECNKLYNFLEISSDVDINYDIWANKPKGLKRKGLIRFFRGCKGILRRLTSDQFTKNMRGPVVRWLMKKILVANDKEVLYTRNPDTCRNLMKEFTDDIKELETIIGRDLTIWTDKYKENDG